LIREIVRERGIDVRPTAVAAELPKSGVRVKAQPVSSEPLRMRQQTTRGDIKAPVAKVPAPASGSISGDGGVIDVGDVSMMTQLTWKYGPNSPARNTRIFAGAM
jgi:hypothetical protein